MQKKRKRIDYKSEAIKLIARVRSLQKEYFEILSRCKYDPGNLYSADKERFVEIVFKWHQLDPQKVILAGLSIPFEEMFFSQVKRNDCEKMRCQKIQKTIEMLLRKGKMKPLSL